VYDESLELPELVRNDEEDLPFSFLPTTRMAKSKVLICSTTRPDLQKKEHGKRAEEPPASPSKIPLPPPSTSNSSLPALLSTLSNRLTETESSLNTLLQSPSTLIEQVDTLPLLDRAKFYVTLTYAIDSLIFCTLHISIL
jgi:hypothetical protein